MELWRRVGGVTKTIDSLCNNSKLVHVYNHTESIWMCQADIYFFMETRDDHIL